MDLGHVGKLPFLFLKENDMDVGKILQQRADEYLEGTKELRERVEVYRSTGVFAPVAEQVTILTQLLLGFTGIAAVVQERTQREQTEAALERVHRMLDPQKNRPLT